MGLCKRDLLNFVLKNILSSHFFNELHMAKENTNLLLWEREDLAHRCAYRIVEV